MADPQLAADPGVDEPHCLSPEALDEFRATQVRGLADMQHGLAHHEQAACWAADDQDEPTAVVRGITDFTEPGHQTLT